MNQFAKKYQKRKPEEGILYKTIQFHVMGVLQNIENSGTSLPQYVTNEILSFLKCGIPSYGFVRLHCKHCRKDKFAAFSCKGRGICPSCGARRMVERSAFLIDSVIPHVRVRQWVLSFPYPLRVFLAKDREILNRIFSIYRRAISSYYWMKARAWGIVGRKKSQTGGIVIIQRFGSALNLNPHFHGVFLDGVYFKDQRGNIKFKSIPAPSDQEIEKINLKIRKRVLRFLHKRGILHLEESDSLVNLSESAHFNLLAASIGHRVAFGERAGKVVLKKRIRDFSVRPSFGESSYKSRCSFIDGFSLHANVEVSGKERGRLEVLLRYINRPALAQERLSQDKEGNILLELKKVFRDGTSQILFSPQEFIEKLLALVPPPRGNLIRFCGVLAPNSRSRKKVVPTQSEPKNTDLKKGKCYWIPWAELLKRVHIHDALCCDFCHGMMKVVAFINDETIAKKILKHLNLPNDPPKILPARDPPQDYYFNE